MAGDDFEILEATISGIRRAFQEKRLTARRLMQRYLDRIEAIDKAGPCLNSIISVNPGALAKADRLDEEFRTSGQLRPLHGIPIVLKDQCDVAGMPTTLGSVLFRDFAPANDAAVVARLRQAGAIVLAKSTLGEFGAGDAHGSLFGSTRNVFDLDRTSGGSSGGSGAAVSANLCTVALGQEGFSSIRRPAAATPAVYRVGFGKPLEQIGETWINAIANPVQPTVVERAPCQERVATGDDLNADGAALDGIPVPISTPGWDNAPYLSAGHYITRDPETGIKNIGNYRGQLKAPRRLGMNPSVLSAGIYTHWLKYKKRADKMPCAVVLGCPPAISYTAVQKLPKNLDEMTVAGALAGASINVVRAKTVDLLVPAEAEIVIEGLIDTAWLEPEAPFGESYGYVDLQDYNAFMEVTAITRRKTAVIPSFISQVTPSESSVIRKAAMEPVYLNQLRNGMGTSAGASAWRCTSR